MSLFVFHSHVRVSQKCVDKTSTHCEMCLGCQSLLNPLSKQCSDSHGVDPVCLCFMSVSSVTGKAVCLGTLLTSACAMVVSLCHESVSEQC